MKKTVLIFSILILTFNTYSQELSYGIMLGGNMYEIYANSALFDEAGTKKIKIYTGGYLEYNFSDKLGVKLDLTYNQKTLKAFEDVDFSFFDISPSVKYSLGQDYHTSTFLTLGPRFSSLLSAELNGDDVESGFESSNIGIQLGVGKSLIDYLEIELKLDYGLTTLYEFQSKDRKIFGGILKLNLNLEKLLN